MISLNSKVGWGTQTGNLARMFLLVSHAKSLGGRHFI